MYPHPVALLVRMILSFSGLIFSILFPIIYGYKQSYSQYYLDSPIFLTATLVALAIGLFMHKNTKWLIPSFTLLLVASFNMYEFPIIHYTAAFFFFLGSSYAMLNDKRISGFGRVSFALYTLFICDLIVFEFFQIVMLSCFHIVYAIKTYNLMKEKNSPS